MLLKRNYLIISFTPDDPADYSAGVILGLFSPRLINFLLLFYLFSIAVFHFAAVALPVFAVDLLPQAASTAEAALLFLPASPPSPPESLEPADFRIYLVVVVLSLLNSHVLALVAVVLLEVMVLLMAVFAVWVLVILVLLMAVLAFVVLVLMVL